MRISVTGNPTPKQEHVSKEILELGFPSESPRAKSSRFREPMGLKEIHELLIAFSAEKEISRSMRPIRRILRPLSGPFDGNCRNVRRGVRNDVPARMSVQMIMSRLPRSICTGAIVLVRHYGRSCCTAAPRRRFRAQTSRDRKSSLQNGAVRAYKRRLFLLRPNTREPSASRIARTGT